MNLIEALICRDLFAQLEESLISLSRRSVLLIYSTELHPKVVRQCIRDLSLRINNIRITLKREKGIKPNYYRYVLISFDMRGKRFKCTWDNKDRALISRSVSDIVTS